MLSHPPAKEFLVVIKPEADLNSIQDEDGLKMQLEVLIRGRGNAYENIPNDSVKLIHQVWANVEGVREKVTVLFENEPWEKLTKPPLNIAFKLYWQGFHGVREGVRVDQYWVPVDRHGRRFFDPGFSEIDLLQLQEKAIKWFRQFVLDLVCERRMVTFEFEEEPSQE